MKPCATCKTVKSESEFHKDARRESGLSGSCKDCRNAKRRKFEQANPEKVSIWRAKSNEKRKTDYSNDPTRRDADRERNLRWREANPQKYKERDQRGQKQNLYCVNPERAARKNAIVAIKKASGLNADAVPEVLIEAKAAQLKVKYSVQSELGDKRYKLKS